MTIDPRTRLQTFTENDLPDLDEVVMGALAFFGEQTIPQLSFEEAKRPLVVGSVNALSTGRLMFKSFDAVFADEGDYSKILERTPGIDGVYLISASGGKHAVDIAKDFSERNLPLTLITSAEHGPAAAHVPKERVVVVPHVREPYTYNTSTYLGMLFAAGAESPSAIRLFIETEVAPLCENRFMSFDAFVLTIPPEFGPVRSMFETKFDELFAPRVTGRSFTSEEIKHAKIIVPSDTQYFVNFGVPSTPYAHDTCQLHIPLPVECGPAALIAIGYYIIGMIQRQHPPYFKENIRAYTEIASRVFRQPVPVIVE